MRVFATCLLAIGLAAGPAWAGDDSKKDTANSVKTASSDKTADPNKPPATEASAAIKTELQQFRDLLKAQGEQIEEQRAALTREEQKIQDLESRLHMTETTGTASGEIAVVTNVPAGSNEAPAADAALAATGEAEAKKASEGGPSSIRFKGITLTPGGYVAAESVYRTHAASADINTPFNSIPYPGNALSKVSESYFTARQSRISLLAQSTIGAVKLTGYYEADWLGTSVNSNNRQSNGYVLR
jgi:hypothetical protein